MKEGSDNIVEKVVTGVIDDVVLKAKTWKRVGKLTTLLSDRDGLIIELREALVTIKMRKILPGKCKYCPF